VIDNFSARVMTNLGLDYDSLRTLRPDVVCVRMTGFGLSGPSRDHVSYGPTLQAITGYTLLMAEPGGRPPASGTRTRISPAEIWAPSRSWRRSGIGAARDAGSSSIWRSSRRWRACSARAARARDDGGVSAPSATRRRSYRPRRTACTPARATIAGSRSPSSRTTSGSASSRPSAGSRTPASRARADRLRHADLLDRMVRRVARGQHAEGAMELLQRAGVACGLVADAEDVCARDPQLAARGHFVDVATPEGRSVRLDGPPFLLSDTPARVSGPGPLLGEHGDAILRDLLGIPDAELDRLRRTASSAERREVFTLTVRHRRVVGSPP
jgi:crotonobetainyl-CoA:carnitine CoA-transferase CaiB-like acyl-CoA transferase